MTRLHELAFWGVDLIINGGSKEFSWRYQIGRKLHVILFHNLDEVEIIDQTFLLNKRNIFWCIGISKIEFYCFLLREEKKLLSEKNIFEAQGKMQVFDATIFFLLFFKISLKEVRCSPKMIVKLDTISFGESLCN